MLIGIIFINRNGLQWRDAPAAYGPHKTLYDCWKRWGDKGIFAQMMAGLDAEHGETKTVMLDGEAGGAIGPSPRPNDLKAHRTATSLGVKSGAWTPDRSDKGRHEHETARYLRQPGPTAQPLRDRRTSQRLHRRSSTAEDLAGCRLAARRPWS